MRRLWGWGRLSFLVALFIYPFTFMLIAHGEVSMEVELGFNGRYFPDSFSPVRVRLINNGPALAGHLVLSQEVRSPWHGVVTETISQDVILNEGAPKLFYFNFFIRGYIYPLKIEFQVGQEAIASQEIELRDNYVQEKLSLALSAPPFPAVLPTGEMVQHISEEALLTDFSGYDGVKRIYLGRFDPARLSLQQRAALKDWLRGGGELIVFSGENWYFQESAWIADLIPFTPLNVSELSLSRGLSPQIVVIGKPRGEILYSKASIPILIKARFGAGLVFFATINPLSVPEEDFWKLLQPPSFGEMERSSFPSLSAEILNQMKLLYPSKVRVGGLILLFVGGTSLLGLLATRKDRRKSQVPSQQVKGFFSTFRLLDWRLLPVCLWVLIISGFTFWYLFQPAYSKPLKSLEIGIIHVHDGRALQRTWYSLYAKKAFSLQLQLKEATALRQFLPQNRGRGLYDLSLAKEPSRNLNLNFRLQKQQQRHFYLEQVSPWSSPLEKTVTSRKSQVQKSFDLRLSTFRLATVLSSETDPIKRALLEAAKEFLHEGVLLGWLQLEDLERLGSEDKTVLKLVIIETETEEGER